MQIIIKTYISQKASTVCDQGLVPMTIHLNDKRKDTHQGASLGRSKTISENWTLPVFVLSFVRLVFLCLNGYTTWTKFCLFQWFLKKTGKPLTNNLVFSLPSYFFACFFFAFVILFCLSVFFLFNCVCEFVLLCKPKPVLKNQRKSGTQTFAMLSLIGFKVNLMNRVGGQFFCLTFSNITSCCPSYSRNERGN